MLSRLWRKIKLLTYKFAYIPRGYIIILVMMFAFALIIRLSTGGTHIVYNAMGKRGIFPGPFLYSVSYIVRIILFSIILYFSLYVRSVYRESILPVLITSLIAVLLLLEYKMIFGGVSLILEMLFTAVSGFLAVLTVIITKVKIGWVSVAALIFALLELLLFIQLISLSICI